MLNEELRGLLAELAREIRGLPSHAGARVIVGIAGAPGAGKSTLAEALAEELGPDAVVVGMDGFHLANSELERLGRRDRKGAPDTFDAAGYVCLLRRLRSRDEAVVYAPRFDRALEESIGSAEPIPADLQVIITEGNYLLLDSPEWAPVARLLDLSLFVELDEPTRLRRLIARHVSYGRSEAEAEAWSLGPDQRNAELIATSRGRADRVIVLGAGA